MVLRGAIRVLKHTQNLAPGQFCIPRLASLDNSDGIDSAAIGLIKLSGLRKGKANPVGKGRAFGRQRRALNGLFPAIRD